MTWQDQLLSFGIKLPDLIAGLLGGLVKALISHKDEPGEAIAATIVGALVANYLGEGMAAKVAEWLPGFSPSRGAACFITGITAMVIVQVIIDQAKKWRKRTHASNNVGSA